MNNNRYVYGYTKGEVSKPEDFTIGEHTHKYEDEHTKTTEAYMADDEREERRRQRRRRFKGSRAWCHQCLQAYHFNNL